MVYIDGKRQRQRLVIDQCRLNMLSLIVRLLSVLGLVACLTYADENRIEMSPKPELCSCVITYDYHTGEIVALMPFFTGISVGENGVVAMNNLSIDIYKAKHGKIQNVASNQVELILYDVFYSKHCFYPTEKKPVVWWKKSETICFLQHNTVSFNGDIISMSIFSKLKLCGKDEEKDKK